MNMYWRLNGLGVLSAVAAYAALWKSLGWFAFLAIVSAVCFGLAGYVYRARRTPFGPVQKWGPAPPRVTGDRDVDRMLDDPEAWYQERRASWPNEAGAFE